VLVTEFGLILWHVIFLFFFTVRVESSIL